MFIETSSPRRKGDNAFFVSQRFDPTTGSGNCLFFWHHMYGSTIGTLNVWLSVNNTKILKWQRKGNKGNKWIQGSFAVRSNSPYQVVPLILSLSLSLPASRPLSRPASLLTSTCGMSTHFHSTYNKCQLTSTYVECQIKKTCLLFSFCEDNIRRYSWLKLHW